MSTVFSPDKPRVAPVAQPAPATRQGPKLRIVYGAPFRPPRMPFVLFVVALLAAGLVGLLLLNTELQRGTFQVTELNKQADQLRDEQEQLERQVRTLESPQNLADRALAMGMVPNPNPVFLRLSDGKVLGVPAEGKPGTGKAMFGPGVPSVTKPTPAATKPPAGTPTGAPTAPTTGQPSTAPTSARTTAPGTARTTAPGTARTTAPATPPRTSPTAQVSRPPSSPNTRPTGGPSKPVPPPTTGAWTTTTTGG